MTDRHTHNTIVSYIPQTALDYVVCDPSVTIFIVYLLLMYIIIIVFAHVRITFIMQQLLVVNRLHLQFCMSDLYICILLVLYYNLFIFQQGLYIQEADITIMVESAIYLTSLTNHTTTINTTYNNIWLHTVSGGHVTPDSPSGLVIMWCRIIQGL